MGDFLGRADQPAAGAGPPFKSILSTLSTGRPPIPALTLTVWLIAITPVRLEACSGPGAGATIARNAELGASTLWVGIGCVLLACVVRALRGRPVVPFALVVLVPVGAFVFLPDPNVGDCGTAYFHGSLAVTALSGAILLAQLVMHPRDGPG